MICELCCLSRGEAAVKDAQMSMGLMLLIHIWSLLLCAKPNELRYLEGVT